MPLQIYPDPLAVIRPVSKIITASYTRPADTTAYAAGDMLADSTSAATVLTFAGVARGNGLGFILDGVSLIYSGAPATKPDLELHLFDTAPTLQNDNATWNPLDADLDKALLMISFPGSGATICAPLASSGNMVQHASPAIRSHACAAGASAIYGVLVVRNAYTPTSGEKFTFRLHAIQD